MVKTEKELSLQAFYDYFDYSKKDEKINMPNEIFKDFKESPLFVTNMHRAFGYSYYFLITYLYRNVKYSKISPSKNVHQMNLLEAMGVNRKAVNYVSKRGGVLDTIGYTLSFHDYPFHCLYDDDGFLGFEMASECNEEMRKYIRFPQFFICKYPKKAFYREGYDEDYTGTFFYYQNTHIIDFQVFAECMCEEKDRLELFYLYGFLKAFEGFINGKDVYMEYLRVSLGFGNAKIKRLLNRLVAMGLVKMNHKTMLRYKMLK